MDLDALSPAQRNALADEVDRELATRDFAAFCKRVQSESDFNFEFSHTRKVAEFLSSGAPRMQLCLPPQTGKSTMAILLMAFAIGRNPRASNIIVTYGQDLSDRHSRSVRDIVSSALWPFSDVKIRDDSRAVGAWQTTQGGGLVAVGAMSAITGISCSGVLLMDDLVKNETEIATLAQQQAFREWYGGTLFSRLQKSTQLISIGTRWSMSDAQSIVLESGGDFETLALPMISHGDGDPLGRPEGTLLWPERFPAELVEEKRKATSSQLWSALYDCDPIAASGQVFESAWLRHFYDEVPLVTRYVPNARGSLKSLPGALHAVTRKPVALMSVDASWGLNAASDYSAIVCAYYDHENFYIDRVWRDRVPYTELVAKIVALYNEYHPRVVGVEKASSGYAALDMLERVHRIPVLGVNSRASKVSRAQAVLSYFEHGNVRFKRNASWYPAFAAEATQFPGGRHDDQVDALVMLLLSTIEGMKVRYSDGSSTGPQPLISFGHG